jgi:hypothetical protein
MSRITRGFVGTGLFAPGVAPYTSEFGGPPLIAAYSVDNGVPGDVITVSGDNLTAVTAVTVCGVAAMFAPSGADLLVTVPEGVCQVGVISVTAPLGSDDGPAFTLLVFRYRFDDPAVAALPPGLVQTYGAALPSRAVALTAATAAIVTGNGPTFDWRQVRGLWLANLETTNEAPRNMEALFVGSIGFVNSEVITDGYGVGPDGAAGSATQVDPNGGFWVDLPDGTFTPVGRMCGVTIWVKDDPLDPPANGPGSVSPSCNVNQARSYLSGGAWRRIVIGDAARAKTRACMRLFCSGQPPASAPAVDYYSGGTVSFFAGNGSFLFALIGAYMSRFSDLPPAFDNPNTATVLPSLHTAVSGAFASQIMGTVLNGDGTIDVQIDLVDSRVKSLDGFTKDDANNQKLRVITMATPDGEWSIDMQKKGWLAKVAGVTAGLTSGVVGLGILGGDQVIRFRMRNDPTANRTIVRAYVAGCVDINAVADVASVGANSAPTAIHPGSDAANAEPMERIVPRMQRLPAGTDIDPEEFVVIGDSTSGTFNSVPPTGGYIYTAQESLDRAGIANYALAGGGVVNQRALWDAGPHKGKDATVKAIIFDGLGHNDIVSVGDFDIIEPFYSAWLANIRTTNPTAKIVWVTMNPSNATLSAPLQAEHALMQTAILGGGPAPFDSDATVDARDDLDTDSSGTIDTAFSPDSLHPYEVTKRTIKGPLIRAALVSLGLL